MWNTRFTFPPPPAPARNKALNKRKALAGSSGGGLAFFIPALFLFRSAPASKTFTNLRPHPAHSRPGRTSALSLPARGSVRSPLAAIAAASPSSSPYPLASFSPLAPISITCSGQPLPVPAVHFPPQPSTSRPGSPLLPRPCTPAPATRSRPGPPFPPRPPTPASAPPLPP